MYSKQCYVMTWLGALLILFGCIVPGHLVQAATYSATADAHTQRSDPRKNYGSTNVLRAQKQANTTGFVKFKLGSLSASAIESATLRVPIKLVDRSGFVTVHRVLWNWSETAITHNNKPAISYARTRFAVSKAAVGRTLNVNVTGLVREMIANGSDSIALSTGGVTVGMGTRHARSPIRLDVTTTQSGRSVDGSSNRKPTITGSRAHTVTTNSNFSFTPRSSDADGDKLSHWVKNKPGWASFNSSTGRLYGVPTNGHVGVHGEISIGVSDGKSSAMLAPIEIEVTRGGAGRASLSWTSPTRNTDGSPLHNLAGFRIDWTRTRNGAKGSVRVNNPSVSTYLVENLAPGNYEFRVLAINDAGIASAPSNKAFKVVK
jgi:hypothetical protein